MSEKWDPRAKPPPKQDDALGYMQWLGEDLTAFQREHPELPQGDVGSLPHRKLNQLLKAWSGARDTAELEDVEKEKGPEFAAIYERFQRRGVLSTSPPQRRKKSNQFYVTNETSAFQAMAAIQSGSVITINGIAGDKVQEFTGVVKSVRRESLRSERWKITMRDAK